jgi:aminoglycoside phosphotransferase (APT) family kinase protein
MRRRSQPDLVFSHNDLIEANVLVDRETLKIKAIIDWEYAGFYPPEFDRPFYKRPGGSVVIEGDVDDVDALKELIARDRERR